MNIEVDIFENMLCFHKNGSNKNYEHILDSDDAMDILAIVDD